LEQGLENVRKVHQILARGPIPDGVGQQSEGLPEISRWQRPWNKTEYEFRPGRGGGTDDNFGVGAISRAPAGAQFLFG